MHIITLANTGSSTSTVGIAVGSVALSTVIIVLVIILVIYRWKLRNWVQKKKNSAIQRYILYEL